MYAVEIYTTTFTLASLSKQVFFPLKCELVVIWSNFDASILHFLTHAQQQQHHQRTT